jgi:hypothetical protein
MAITVLCPGCKKRFSVHDKFAGKKGPCPKCKTIIQVPEKTEQVVVHTPDEFGPKNATGRATLKPIARIDTAFSPLLTAGIVVAALGTLVAAWLLRTPDGKVSGFLLALGAIGLGPPLAWGGYAFLRDDELEPFRGREAWLRVGICGLVYAAVWGLEAFVSASAFGGKPFGVEYMALVIPAMVALGAFGAWASLELDFGIGALHYGLYLAVTVVLRLIMSLPVVGPPR